MWVELHLIHAYCKHVPIAALDCMIKETHNGLGSYLKIRSEDLKVSNPMLTTRSLPPYQFHGLARSSR